MFMQSLCMLLLLSGAEAQQTHPDTFHCSGSKSCDENETDKTVLLQARAKVTQDVGPHAVSEAVPHADVQFASMEQQNTDSDPDCRSFAKKTCPSLEQVQEQPAGSARHQCWDANTMTWWKACRCNFGQMGIECGASNGVPCLVKILEVVGDGCYATTTTTTTTSGPPMTEYEKYQADRAQYNFSDPDDVLRYYNEDNKLAWKVLEAPEGKCAKIESPSCATCGDYYQGCMTPKTCRCYYYPSTKFGAKCFTKSFGETIKTNGQNADISCIEESGLPYAPPQD